MCRRGSRKICMGPGLGRLWKGATKMMLLLQACMTGRMLVMQCLGGMTEVNFGHVKPLACPVRWGVSETAEEGD